MGATAYGQQATTLSTTTQVAGDYIILPTRPNMEQDGRQLLCGANNPDCVIFNRQMCRPDFQHVPLRLVVRRGASTPAPPASSNPTHKAYVWLQPRSGVCTTMPPSPDQPIWPTPAASTRVDLSQASSLISPEGNVSMAVPDDLTGWHQDGTVSLTTADIIHAFPKVCAKPGLSPTRWRLCVGVDLADYGVINNQAAAGQSGTGSLAGGGGGSSTPTAWIEFMVATTQPPAPQLTSLQERNGAVELTVQVPNQDQTTRGVVVHFSPRPELAGLDCNLWSGEVQRMEQDIAAAGQSTQPVVLRVPGDTGVRYSYCAFSRDLARNLSVGSGPLSGTPNLESGPFTALDGPHGGYGCRSTATATLWPLAWGLSWAARRRARARAGA